MAHYIPKEIAMKAFEKLHGKGSYSRLVHRLYHNSLSLADIATEFHVTRQMIGKMAKRICPKRGDARREYILARRATRYAEALENSMIELFSNRKFSSFYDSIYLDLQPEDIAFIPNRQRHWSFRKDIVAVKGKKVKLCRARSTNSSYGIAYSIHIPEEPAGYVWYYGDRHFWLMPRSILPHNNTHHTTFRDSARSKYRRYRGTLDVLKAQTPVKKAA